jgi:predicted RNase H-like HicB family nuclease
MLTEYIDSAMRKASYQKLEDGTFFGKIPDCPGVLAFHATRAGCQQELRSALEGWLIVKLRHGDLIPVIGNIDLNLKAAVNE